MSWLALAVSRSRRWPAGVARLAVAALALLTSGTVLAHAGEGAYLQLLPTGSYLVGGALVVALSFVLMAWLPVRWLRRVRDMQRPLATAPLPGWPSFAMLLIVSLLVAAGWLGSRDPLDNPLPTILWSLWWAGFTVLHAALGNLWSVLSPWPALHRLATGLPVLTHLREKRVFDYPAWLGQWPAVTLLGGFAWLELVYPAPQDPARLAAAATVYAALTAVGMLLFGRDTWLHHGETFSVFFRMVARNSPFATRPAHDPHPRRRQLLLRPPGAGLLSGHTPSVSGTVFVLLALSTVSFDGLSSTFWWIDLLGENPLEYPGRSELVARNTAGLLATFAVLATGYLLAVWLGARLAGSDDRAAAAAPYRAFVRSIIPIAFGYHVAHYLPYLLVEAQYALRALGDPFALGWNLLGLRDLHVHAAFLSDHASVSAIWHFQVLAIVGAHVVAVSAAHAIALEHGHSRRQALLSQAPMTALMVGYTLLGLWLLSTPAV